MCSHLHRRLLFVALLIALPSRAALPTPDPDDGAITLPPGFRAVVVADNLVVGRRVGNSQDNLRFLAVAENGDLYAKSRHGGIFALRDTDGDGRFDLQKNFGTGEGTGIALRDGWLYYSTNSAVYRYKLTPGELVPMGEPECIVTGLPTEKRTHDAKSFAFDGEGRLLVEVGAPYNVYSDGDRALGAKGKDATEFLKRFGGFWRFDPNKPNQTPADGFHFSTGHRHSLAIAWHPVSKEFFMVQMGRDQLNTVDPVHYDELDNAERVSEVMHLLREGANLGWPYTYYDPIKKARMIAPEFGGDNVKRAESGKYDEPLIAFPAHWAPLQMAIYSGTQFPEKYRGGAFIAFHGSWNRAPRAQAGYKVAFVPFTKAGMPTGAYETFADNFAGRTDFTRPRDARFRPGGLTVGSDGSLYVGDTDKGRIWRIIYTGEAAVPRDSNTNAAVAPPAVVPAATAHPRGQAIYAQICAACHMADGSGVTNLQPALLNNATVKGDPVLLIRVLLHGPAAALPADRPKFGNVMPPFAAMYNDQQVADVLSYVREAFGGSASAISAADVGAVRNAK